MTHYLALDVGVTTGIAVYDTEEDVFVYLNSVTPERLNIVLYEVFKTYNIETIIIENPAVRPVHVSTDLRKDMQRLSSFVYNIVNREKNLRSAIVQIRPADWKPITGNRYKHMQTFKSVHEQDAAEMLIFYLEKEGIV